MERFKSVIHELFDDASTLQFADVPFRSEVRALCEQNSCGMFAKTWTCPPAVGSLDEWQGRLSKYPQVIIFSKVYQLADSFDWEGMKSGVLDFQSRVLQLKKKLKKADPDFDSIVLGAGACSLCQNCTYEQDIQCKNPEYAIVSVEACGIDVMSMMRDNGMAYNNGPNTVTYVGTLFF